MNVYEIRGLTKVYAGQTQPANCEIDLDVQRGEILGILGDNGSGKTTLVRQMANLLRSTSGEIRFLGQSLSAASQLVASRVGYMPQDSMALNNVTVGEALYYTAHLRGLRRAEAKRERDRLLDLWQMGEWAKKPSSRLSGGQRRMLRLAVAMAGRPPILILDEPTNDLDPVRRRLVWQVLRQANAEHGTTIVFITHDATEAEKVIQRVAIMRQGRLAVVGRPAILKSQLDQRARLELFFSPGAPPDLPSDIVPQELDPGRWLIRLPSAQAPAILGQLDLSQLEDYRLYSATLEDLYVHYAV